ncbi:hypothetical protein [Streptomyces sp. NBC_00083]|uniref:hypothetical protein n=1 Tax=Streptomyces sp. NBC_00083 TaxID=2975647 RepID=UPI00225BB6ED|nr:hypothetical protein [Streptomyces sp. NBC_00083]MCX5385299.1 hypothetical protein [Streptomyces sp. NBC_00083]
MRLPRTEPAVVAVTGACLLLALLLGVTPVLTALTAHAGWILVPSALGAPLALPPLRAVPLGGLTLLQLLCEDFAVAVLLTVAGLRMRRHVRLRPAAGRARRALAGWTALVAGGAASGLWRGLVTARVADAGVGGWVVYGVVGVVLGAAWGLLLGWLPAAAAAGWAGPGAPGVSIPPPTPADRAGVPRSSPRP